MSTIPVGLLPNLFYILLIASVWSATFAIITPGTGVFELMALFALGGTGIGLFYVPYNLWALVPLILGISAFIFALWKKEFANVSLGLSVILISLGSILLFGSESGRVALNPLLATVVTLFTLLLYWVGIRQIIAAHRLRTAYDPSLILEHVGEVRTALDPVGTVYVKGELWSAEADEKILEGEQIQVTGRKGLMLFVAQLERRARVKRRRNMVDDVTLTFLACIFIALVLVVLSALASAIRVIQEYERLVVFRLGRSVGEKGPGLILLWPVIERGVKVDLREQVREIPHQTSITLDNAPIDIDFLWYYKVVNAQLSIIAVGNFEKAAQGMAVTTLRSVIGGIPLGDVLSQRDHINQVLRTKLDEVTERWGVKVTNVEIREIIPPKDVQDAMNRQMTAERVRRAVVTESTGQRDAEINVAQGEKKSAILRAEGDRESNMIRAEGDRQAQLLRAEGFASALKRISSVAQDIDQKTMTLQYFETLKDMGSGASTKLIFPMEFTSLLENFLKKE